MVLRYLEDELRCLAWGRLRGVFITFLESTIEETLASGDSSPGIRRNELRHQVWAMLNSLGLVDNWSPAQPGKDDRIYHASSGLNARGIGRDLIERFEWDIGLNEPVGQVAE